MSFNHKINRDKLELTNSGPKLKDLDQKNVDRITDPICSDTPSLTKQIISSVIDWANDVNTSKKNNSSKLYWDPLQYKFLNETLSKQAKNLLPLKIANIKLRSYILKILNQGLNKDDIEFFYQNREKLPLNILGFEINRGNFECTKMNRLTSTKKIEAGYYMLELQISPSTNQKTDRLIVKSHSPIHHFESKVARHRICKRLIFLPKNTHIDLLVNNGLPTPEFTHFKLIRLSKNFFLSRLLKKLRSFGAIKKIELINDYEFQELWLQYDSLFRETRPEDEYEYFLKKIEPSIIPSKEQQLNQLKAWKVIKK